MQLLWPPSLRGWADRADGNSPVWCPSMAVGGKGFLSKSLTLVGLQRNLLFVHVFCNSSGER